MKRKAIVASVLVIIAVIGIRTYLHHHKVNSNRPTNVVNVDIAEVKQGAIPIEVHAIGSLVAANDIVITSEVAGHVASVLFQDGAFVKKDTPLIQLDDKVYRAKYESAKANLLYSKTDYDRKKLLGKQGAIAQQAIDQALADTKEKEAAAEESRVTVQKMLLTAPFDGVVGKSQVSPGDYVTVGHGLVSLTDIHHLHVEYSVPEKYLSQLKLGQETKITTPAYPDKEFIGKVAYISPTINKDDRTISLYAEVPNEQRLLTAGLFVNVTQKLGIENNALIVPAMSLVPTIDGEEIFKIVDHKAVAVQVQVGQRIKDNVQVASGLKPKDAIVISGQQNLKDGMTVEINKAKPL